MDSFLRLASRVEAWLMKVAVLCLTVLVVSQGWLADGGTGRWLVFVDPAEWVLPDNSNGPAVPVTAAPSRLEVAVRIEGRPAAYGAVVMVNGRWTAAFAKDVVVVQVDPGDRLTIDARGYREPLSFRVIRVSPGVARPSSGQGVTTTAGVADLGRVTLKH